MEDPMADHLIRGTLTYVVIDCGNGQCSHTWEQAHTDLDNPGWNVCPRCEFAAPTNVRRDLRRNVYDNAEAA
jgi:hypothetical protein